MVLQIGTASFANKYGILNQKVLDDKREIEKIIYYCYKKNITLDSSPNYGQSLNYINILSKDFVSKIEEALDNYPTALLNRAREIVSKYGSRKVEMKKLEKIYRELGD